MIPPIIVAHDLSGYGACSLGIVLPVLAACGLDPCALPTAVLSSHTAFAEYTMVEMSSAMQDTLQVWEKLQIPFRGAYTGFFANAAEIRQMTELAARQPAWTWVADPVLGDRGRLYRTVQPEMVQEMRQLAAHADLLLPNLTEAALLLDRPYPGETLSPAEAEELLDALLALGARTVVLKGLLRTVDSPEHPGPTGQTQMVNAVKGSGQPYRELCHPYVDGKFFGTGDLFASVLAAGSFLGKAFLPLLEAAGDLLAEAVKNSLADPIYRQRGVAFEPLIPAIAARVSALPDAGNSSVPE